MQLVTFSQAGEQPRPGALLAREGQKYVLDLRQADERLPGSMMELLQAGETALALARLAVERLPERALLPLGEALRLHAPIPRPGKIVCLGHNYYDHMGIGRSEPPEFPTIFGKPASCVIGPGEPICIPSETQQVDYEAELAVVIGRTARRVPEERAFEYVAGYTIFNDVSARDYQKRTSQWMLGKAFDTFGPMGPALVSADEITDPHNLGLSLTVNDLELQRTNTGSMIFSIPYLIAYLSAVMTLEPGDLISTGTPAKTELAKSIPPFLKPGDIVKIWVEGVGELVSSVQAE